MPFHALCLLLACFAVSAGGLERSATELEGTTGLSEVVTIIVEPIDSTFDKDAYIASVRASMPITTEVIIKALLFVTGNTASFEVVFTTGTVSQSTLTGLAIELMRQANTAGSDLRIAQPLTVQAYYTTAAPQGTSTPDGDNGPNGGEIAVIVICSVILCGLLTCCIVFLCLKTKRDREHGKARKEKSGKKTAVRQANAGKVHIIATAITMHHNTIEAGLDTITEPGADKAKAVITIEKLREFLQTCRVPHLSNAFIASLRRSKSDQERGVVRRSYLLNTLRASLAGGAKGEKGCDQTLVDRAFEYEVCPVMYEVFNKAGGQEGSTTANQLLQAIRQDPQVTWTTQAPKRNWGGPMLAELDARNPAMVVTWEEFATLCCSAFSEMHAREGAGVQTHENNPLLLVPVMNTLEFKAGDNVSAEFHGEWFPAVVTEAVGQRDELPDGGYVVTWGDGSRTLVQRVEVRAADTTDTTPPPPPPPLDPNHRGIDTQDVEILSDAGGNTDTSEAKEAEAAAADAPHGAEVSGSAASDAAGDDGADLETQPSLPAAPEAAAGQDYDLGVKVLVLWGDPASWYDGTVVGYDSTSNTYNVDWGDGTGTENIAPESIKTV